MKIIKAGLTVFLILTVTALFAWKAGDRILGKWGDGLWYPAQITGVAGDKFKVAFFDGDVGELSAAQIKAIDWKIGTTVECNWKNQGKYYSGKITQMKGDMVHINYDDGDQEDATISRCRSN